MKKAILLILFPFWLLASCYFEAETAEPNPWPQYIDRDCRAIVITKGCKTDYEKAEAIYRWLCDNISYDNDYQIYDGELCWEMRKGVCNAYSELFVSIAHECGLTAKKIVGYAKTDEPFDEHEKHAWIAVRVNGRWLLADPTWGAGSICRRKFVRNPNCMSWFDVDPHWMIFTHFPDDKSFQLLPAPLSFAQYQKLPLLNPSKFTSKLDASEHLAYCLKHPDSPTVQVYSNYEAESHLDFLEMPTQCVLQTGRSYTFKIRSTSLRDEPILFLPGESRKRTPKSKWHKDGDIYTITVRPKQSGEIMLCYETDYFLVSHISGIISYPVV